MVLGLAALVLSALMYLLSMPQDGYVFLVGMLFLLASGLASALRREGGAKAEDAVTLIAGISFFAWLAWKTFNR